MRKENDVIKTDLLVVEDTEYGGIVEGHLRVESNAHVIVKGIVNGNVHVTSGRVEIRGMVNGNVRNEGGTVRVTGMVDGTITGAPGTTEIVPGAVVQGKVV